MNQSECMKYRHHIEKMARVGCRGMAEQFSPNHDERKEAVRHLKRCLRSPEHAYRRVRWGSRFEQCRISKPDNCEYYVAIEQTHNRSWTFRISLRK